MDKLLSACGNDCSACPRYTASPYEKSEDELRHTAELWYKIGYRDKIVSVDEISCNGCKPENWCRYHVVKCCEDKGIRNCSECISLKGNRSIRTNRVCASCKCSISHIVFHYLNHISGCLSYSCHFIKSNTVPITN